MNTTRKPTRNTNRARAVLVHPELHRLLANNAREEGYSIQDRLHLMLCREFGRKDLASHDPVPAMSSQAS